jgi:hypothetical protein
MYPDHSSLTARTILIYSGFKKTLSTQTHFLVAGILAQHDFDLSRKRNRQVIEYQGLGVWVVE